MESEVVQELVTVPGYLTVHVQIDGNPEDETSAIFQMDSSVPDQIIKDLAEFILGLLRNAKGPRRSLQRLVSTTLVFFLVFA